jgi:citronellyl-CoA synthetase
MPPADLPFPQGATLNELFEAAVLANPESIALEGLESSLSYSELQQWANCIASVVMDNVVNRGDRVFILIDDTLLSAAIILGLG